MASSSHTAKSVRTVIKLLLMVVYLGIVLIWIMLPTKTYRQKWLPHLKAKFNFTTYFGAQGTSLLIYTFPFIFIAVAGCVYLHLGKTLYDNKLESNVKKDHLELWKRPMLVKDPLGIVSSIELTFFMMFIALLIWSLSTYLHNSFTMITPQSAEEEGEKVWEAKLVVTGLRLGVIGNICLTLLFFHVARRFIGVS